MGTRHPGVAPGRAGAAAGVTGAGVAILAAAAVHTLFPRVPFAPVTVAEALVRATPGDVATFFIERLQGLALPLAVVASTAGFAASGALMGMLLPRVSAGLGGGIFPAALALGAPLYALGVLLMHPDSQTVARSTYAVALLPTYALAARVSARRFERLTEAPTRPVAPDPARREFVRALWIGAAGLAVGWAGVGRLLFRRPNPGRLVLRVKDLRPAPLPSPAPGDEAFEGIEGLSSEITQNERFYVVDEEIIDPEVEPDSWTLLVGGLVDHPYELSYDELLALPVGERFVTLECISNPVGGPLISTAKWAGIPVATLLARAGVRTGAVEVVSRAIGGYSDSIPVAEAMAGGPLVVVGMNGRVLPREHGFPARLLVPGRFGMKQPKWLEAIEVVDRPHTGYWEARGWSKAAVVKTMSRIDATAEEPDGSLTIAGVAFAGERGISRVEVSADGGRSWGEAELKTALSDATWRLWRYPSLPGSGSATILVRAEDGRGEEQIQRVAPPHPSGASGYDEVTVDGA